MKTVRQQLMLHPVSLLRSLLVSRRARSAGGLRIPIVTSPSTRFELARDALIEADGRVVFDSHYFSGSDWLGQLPAGPTRVRMAGRSRLRLGSWVRIGGGVQLVVGPDAILDIGSDTFINPNSRIVCALAITIGCRCAISWGVTIFDFIGGHNVTIDGQRLEDLVPVHIEDDVLIGAGATVLRGVTIGAGAVVAAASVVTNDVPTGSLVAGNPARVISSAVSWSG